VVCARCHDEQANFLALNLMNDIVKGQKSVEEARRYYSKEFLDYRRKKPTPYMDKSDVVGELDLPPPLGTVLGVPPGSQDAGLASGQDDQSTEILISRPAVLEDDPAAAADEVAHWARLASLKVASLGPHRSVLSTDRHVQRGRGGMHQDAVARHVTVDAGPSER
jgi:hypothetical protein